MRLLAQKSYREFRDAIPKEFTSTTGMDKGARVADFREIVGEQARLYRREQMPRAGNKELRHKRWATWLADVHFDEASWEEVKSIDDDVISDLKDKQPAIKFYIAVYYRLHACIEHPQYADRIDSVVFGNGLRKSGNPVFISFPEGPQRLQASFPRNIKLDRTYQFGRPEFVATKKALLNNVSDSSSSVVAIHGPGGYGKTALVEELCLDEEVKRAFSGGIYWLQFGMLYDRNSLKRDGFIREQDAIDQMLRSQYEASEISGRAVDSVRKLSSNLPDRRLLLVADDVWNTSQSEWLDQLPEQVTVLLTTRHVALTRGWSCTIPITRLDQAASYRLISDGMSEMTEDLELRLLALCEGFKGWPLIIRLANGRFKRDYGRSSLESIVDEYEQVLHDRSIRGWDIDGTEDDRTVKRRTLVGYCLQAGLDALVNHAEREALASLAVFPDDTDIPVSVVSDFWGHTLTHELGQHTFTSVQANALLAEFDDLSFLRTYTGAEGYIRLHDEVLAYLRTLHTPDQDQLLHQRMIQAIRRHCESGEWHRLPSYHSYGWKHLLYHLEQGNEYETARKLRLDFQWMKSKLVATDIYELQRSYLTDESLESVLIYNALGRSAFGITKRPSSLAHHLFGQLGDDLEPGILELLGELSLDTSFWPRPSFPHLRASRSSTADYFGHRVVVSTVIFGSNGGQFVTASADRSVRIWDAATRRQVGRSMVHPGYIVGAWLDPKLTFILTTCTDYSARIWGFNTQEELVPAMRHVAPIRSASLDSTGKLLATASSDGTARVWSVKSGSQLIDALKHGAGVTSAKFDSSGHKLITLTSDGDLSVWLTSNGELISRSTSQGGPGGKIVFDSDLRHFLTFSNNTVHLWDADLTPSIKESLILDAPVRDAFFSPDGTHLCTIQSDGRVRLWRQEGNQSASYSLTHRGWVSAASFDPSGRWLVTFCSDCALNVWDVTSRSCVSVVDLQASVTASDWSGSRLILGSADGRIMMFDFPSRNSVADDNC